ncbi:MAG: sigma-54-dependent Fis family transcriptional regulator [Gammaproteobacteria bacterium]|nr:sigma-54-dependent Fis family transcriptional regulator [Gammaproteobacteria bacterium]
MANTILIIEDEDLLAQEMAHHFRRDRWRIIIAPTLAQAEHLVSAQGINPMIVISDMTLPDGNALDLLEKLGAGESEWIFLTGYGTIADSVRALRLGAFDFLEKPVEFSRLDMVVAAAARSVRANRRLDDASRQASQIYTFDSLIGESALIKEVKEYLMRLCSAPFKALVISGETGTGKGVVARILHHNSLRSKGPLIEVNCAALPSELMESELFGHEAGSFTGSTGKRRGLMEQADGGTLFLDEISEMPLLLQSKLLKVVEEQSFRRVGGEREIFVDVQIIAASNRDLADGVVAHTFREDLYHRLSAFHLHLPALRDHIEDLNEFLPLFLAEFNAKLGKNVKIIPEKVRERMHGHRWSGNIRELRYVVERCVMFAQSEVFPMKWLQLEEFPESGADTSPGQGSDGKVQAAVNTRQDDYLRIPLDGSLSLDEMDRVIIEAALSRHGYNVAAAARALGTTRDTLRYRIQKYGLKHDVSSNHH